MTSPIDRVLSNLSTVRKGKPGQWMACCPAHKDKAPSLSVRENTDGSVLLHCFAGCAVQDVLAALGLEMNELYPPKDRPASAPKRLAPALTKAQGLDLLNDEAAIVAIVAGDVGRGRRVSRDDCARAHVAAGRIAYIRHRTME